MQLSEIPPYRPHSPIKRAIHTLRVKVAMLATLSVVIFIAGGVFFMWALMMDIHHRRLAHRR